MQNKRFNYLNQNIKYVYLLNFILDVLMSYSGRMYIYMHYTDLQVVNFRVKFITFKLY